MSGMRNNERCSTLGAGHPYWGWRFRAPIVMVALERGRHLNSPLRILITTLELDTRRGVQNVSRDLAVGLRDAGHDPVIYTRKSGSVAADLRATGFQVETNVQALDGPFDVIHGHHLVACSPALARYPYTPAVFVCHDNVSWFDAAPRLPSIRRHAAVSESLVDRVAFDAGVDRSSVALILNGVDTARFAPGPAPPTKPARALAFAKNEDHIAVIREACAHRKIAVDFVGAATGVNLEDPSKVLPTYDLVFASALSALEAMSCVRPVIVCDGRGMAGMVDRKRYEAWRPQNFGLAILNAPLSVDRALAEIDRFDVTESQHVGERVRQEAQIAPWISRYITLYREAIEAPPPSPDAAPLQWAQHLERWTPRAVEHWSWTDDRQTLTNEIRRLRAGAEVLPVGDRLAFGKEGAATRFIEPAGFEPQHDGAVWTSARFASLRFRPGPIKVGYALTLEYAVCLPDVGFTLEITALQNGVEVDRWIETGFQGWTERSHEVLLPAELSHPVATWLSFCFAQKAGAPPAHAPAFSPRALTFRPDVRADRQHRAHK
ncbi:glycosyltransferase [Candidatus Viadribacter manganicus]|nr:glycosyltransferase [Candidatus Viadribacter manganicus]